MKNIGYLLLTAGFLIAAFYAVEQREGVRVAYYLAALGLGVLGVTLLRLIRRREATSARKPKKRWIAHASTCNA